MGPISQFNEFHRAVVEGKNEFLKLFVLANGTDS